MRELLVFTREELESKRNTFKRLEAAGSYTEDQKKVWHGNRLLIESLLSTGVDFDEVEKNGKENYLPDVDS